MFRYKALLPLDFCHSTASVIFSRTICLNPSGSRSTLHFANARQTLTNLLSMSGHCMMMASAYPLGGESLSKLTLERYTQVFFSPFLPRLTITGNVSSPSSLSVSIHPTFPAYLPAMNQILAPFVMFRSYETNIQVFNSFKPSLHRNNKTQVSNLRIGEAILYLTLILLLNQML